MVQSHRYRGLWPPNWNLKHYKLVDFCQIWMSNPPCKKVNPPHTNVKSPYWRLFGDGFVVVLIWLSKHTRSPNYHCFRSQRIYYTKITLCSYEHGAEKILTLSNIQQMSKCQPYSNGSCLYIRTYPWSWQSAAQLCLWSAVYQRWRCYKYNYEISEKKNDRVAIALMILHHNVKVTYSKSI